MRVGVILPNYGDDATPDAVRAVAEAAEELAFDGVWATEHILVGSEAVGRFGRVLDPLSTLSWIAGYTTRVALGTSIVLAPLHHPIRLAKEAATLQGLSGGRFRLGVGIGWHEAEFDYLGIGFHDRGRRADEALRLIRALWAGERSFGGDYWSFEDATFAPLPSPIPEIWVGGNSDRAVRRARELGDVWHPTGDTTAERVREVRSRFGDLRVVPRISGGPELALGLEELADAGCEGAVVSFGLEPGGAVRSMREFAGGR